MNTIKDIVLIEARKDSKSLHKIEGTNITLTLIPQWREYEEDMVTQSGIVVGLPSRIKGGGDIKVKEGDKVYCHHFLTHHENDASYVKCDTWAINYDQLYCRIVDGEIEMLDTWNLLEIVEESQMKGNLFITLEKKKTVGLGIMRYPSKKMAHSGITNGTYVEFKRNCGYIILVEGKKYYRLNDDHILLGYEE